MTRILSAALAAAALLAGGAAVAAAQATNEDPKKVFVCKYVGTPGADERLQTGQNPISVSVNALPGGASVGAFFADAQGRSYVLAFDTGQPEPSPDNCPQPENPPPTEPTPLLTGATFAEATCTTGPSFQFTRTFLAGIGNRPFYLVDGPLVDGRPVAGQTYTITAQSVVGFILTGQTVWTHTFAATPTNCGSTPPPPPPRVCPDGLPPTPGEGAFDPNDDCKRPPAPPAPPAPVTTTPVTPAATPPPPAVTSTTEETTPAETTPEQPASSPGKPAEANPPAANPPQPKTGQPAKGSPAPKPKNKPCPPNTREHNGTCNAIVQGNG